MTGSDGPPVPALRAEIEALDEELVAMIARRVGLARRIGRAKQAARDATLDPAREAVVIRRATAAARDHGLPTEPVREIFWTLLGLCRGAQLEDR